jgi:hypothetical protein
MKKEAQLKLNLMQILMILNYRNAMQVKNKVRLQKHLNMVLSLQILKCNHSRKMKKLDLEVLQKLKIF